MAIENGIQNECTSIQHNFVDQLGNEISEFND